MERLPWVDVTYCKYGTPYRKQTRLWTNMRSWQDGRHLRAAQRGPRLMEGQYERVSQSRELLYSVPAALCEEIARAATEELAERLSIFRTRLPLENAHFSMFLHVFLAVPLCFKNEAEGHPRLFSRFLGAFKSGVTKHQKWRRGAPPPFFSFFGRIQKRCH